MDVVGFVVDVTSRGWNYIQEIQFEEKLDELRTLMGQLRAHRDGVLCRVEAAEARLLKRTPAVDVWLKDFDVLDKDVTDVLQEGDRLLQICCISFWCPWNCWTNQKFGKKVMSRISLVTDLRHKGDLQGQDVAERPTITPVQEVPEDPNTVGLHAAYATACSFLQQDSAKILGIYGPGGVGKTTLLKKINNMFPAASSSGFDFVIWAVVSKDVSMVHVQKDIGVRLGLSWADSVGMRSRAQDIFNMLRRKKFLLLLDDIWERLELTDHIGIPAPTSENKSKIIFTTRSYNVCGLMEANEKILVKRLNAGEAWELFQSKVGVICNDPEIKPLAKAVAEECGGLPLALTVIGRTMASKTTVREWENAITMLRKHAQAFAGMEADVYKFLKYSYDCLPNDSVRSCFLFCSLYPEDCNIHIEWVVREWIGQGYIDEFDEWEEAVNMGHYVIGVLKASCLLEPAGYRDTFVKMHDVIRDMAHWIVCECGREKDRILVIGDDGISETRRTEKLKSAQMISMSNAAAGFDSLGKRPDCPKVTTLLSRGSEMGRRVRLRYDLFLLMRALRFLSLGDVTVANVPKSIGKLVRLEYLSLDFEFDQDEESFNFKAVILPGEMKNLTGLRYLYLTGQYGSCRMPVGVIGHLSNLQVFHPEAICFGEDMRAYIQELGCLNRLISLEHITISKAEDLEFFFSHRRLLDYTIGLEINDVFGTGDRKIIKCPPSSSSSSCLSLGSMKRLKHLKIGDLDEKEIDLCQSLESIELENLPKFKDVRNDHGLCFGSLKEVTIQGCPSMLNVTWLLAAPKLESFGISDCDGVEEILCEGFGAIEENTFSNLKKFKLWDLPNLRVICANVLPFPSLEEIIVRKCPGLRQLPLKPNNKLRTIEGSQEWWDNLEWESDTTKSAFAQFYKLWYEYEGSS